MTATTHTQAALLVAAVTALNKQITASKKGGVEVPGIGAEIVPGIKLRDLKSWLKDFTAKQADASKPAAATKPAAAKPAAAKTAPAPVPADMVEFTAKELKGAELLIGRAKDQIKSVVKAPEGDRVAVTESGVRIPVANLERNNRGNLRVKLGMEPGKAPVGKKPAAVKQEELPEEVPAASGARTYAIRVLDIKKSTQLTGAEYDRNTSTLFVTLKDAAVWAYEGVKLSEVRAFEQAALPWKHFSAHIANDKKGRMVKNHKAAAPVAEKAPVATAKTTAAKPATAPVPQVAEVSTTALRADGFMDGRKHETVQSINRVKETGQRIVVTASGKRIPLESIILAKGKFRVSELALISGAINPAPAAVKGTENTRKNGKAQKLDFSAEKAPVKTPAKVTSEKPSREQVKEAGVRVVKGAKEKLVNVIRVVKRDDVLMAVTDNKGALPYSLIMSFDGQPTYTGKITAEEFRAL